MYFKLGYDYPMDEDGGYYMPRDGLDFDGIESWALGRPFAKPPPDPMRIELVPVADFTGEPAAMFDRYMCLMSPPMVEALRRSGVDNIDTYPALLVDAANERQFDYFGVNILGLVAAADLGKSQWTNFDGAPRLDTHFETLAVDPAKARGHLMFRLAEDTGTIIVHAKIKQGLESAGIPGLRFTPV
jgi:uncharacterized protein DUF1629